MHSNFNDLKTKIMKRKILKKAMRASYCGKTRFDYLDKEELPMIYKAMEEYHQVKLKLLGIADVSGCFSLARYINGYYEYSDNTDDGDIYMNVVTKKFMTETEILKEWVRLNNS